MIPGGALISGGLLGIVRLKLCPKEPPAEVCVPPGLNHLFKVCALALLTSTGEPIA